MKENLTIGLLVLIAITSIANTVMLMGNDSVAYETTPINSPVVSNAAASQQDMQQQQMQQQQQQMQQQAEAQAQVPAGPSTSIQFAETSHDFGNIQQNTKNAKKFSFTNTGENPLIISDAKGSCGCTVPSYPRHPIQPGETAEIEVIYEPGQQANQQMKTVTITANTEPATTVLQIKANVESAG